MEHLERDCTQKCKSPMHAKQILDCTTFATPSQIRSYAVGMCNNFSVILDKLGRNMLHVASSCGRYEIVEWLIKQCGAHVDIRDKESGWSALHRSFFYGHLACAAILCMNGASLKITDHEGLTPLDIITKDRLPYIEYQHFDPSDVYVWGSNSNYNLGLENAQNRDTPEILECFRKDSIDIQQVEICKFHSVFLTSKGQVYTCGYGHGGRLGQETEDISLRPSPIKALESQTCTQVAAGQDHILFFLKNRQVWSCGLNFYHQLGQIPPPERALTPKPISLKFLKEKNSFLGICAARFHSVIYTKNCIFTFGLNAGQLGHPKGDRTQLNPRQVSALNTEECHLTHVATSDGAIVCATNRGDIYVLHEYQIRKIASRQLGIQKLSVVGGHLDSRCNVAGVTESGGLELKVALLTKYGKLYLWRQSDPYLRRCLFTSQTKLIISDIHISHYSIGMITSTNEGYIGNLSPLEGKKPAIAPSTTLPSNINSGTSTGLTILLNTDECHFIKAKKLPNIYRGTSITSDSKGKNFAVLQSNPKMGLIEVPFISESLMAQDFSRLFLETHKSDDFHDIIIKVGKREFAAHKYILASRSEYFNKQLKKEGYGVLISIDNVVVEAFEQVLKFIYTNHCDFLNPGYEVNWALKETGKKSKAQSKTFSPIHILQEVSKRFGISRLAKKLNGIKLENGKIIIDESDPVPRLTFKRQALTNLHDVNLISSEGSKFGCHRCVLISRLDYFHSMLSTSWAENASLANITLPISSKLIDVLLEYIYTDDAIKISNLDDVEFLCQVMSIADQLLVLRLKEICEVSLSKLISLKNVVDLLELSAIYNSVQLKRTCMQFICINLAAIVESKVLDTLSEDVLTELCSYYQNLVPSIQQRKILSYRYAVENLAFFEEHFPVSNTTVFEKNKEESIENKSKYKRRRTTSKESSTVVENDISSPEKNIVLDILIPDPIKEINTVAEKNSVKKGEDVSNVMNTPKQHRMPGQWVMSCLSKSQISTLDTIMLEEKRKLVPIQKANIPEMSPFPHLSQKQKKSLEATKKQTEKITIPNSPPNRTPCPWAKLPEQSPPSPSFWDAVGKKEVQPSFLCKDFGTGTAKEMSAMQKKNLGSNISQDVTISLHDIQIAEEQRLHRAVKIKIKPLHLLNIEDKAIEELSELYNAKDNSKEKITISRVQPEEQASPIWNVKKLII